MSNYELIEISPSKLLDSKGEKGNMYVVKPINHCTNFEIGFPIPKKFVKAIEIQTFETTAQLMLVTNVAPCSFKISCQTQIDPLNSDDVFTNTVYNQILNLDEELGLSDKTIQYYLKQFETPLLSQLKLNDAQYTQISKDVNRTLLRIPVNFSVTDYFRISDLNPFLRPEYFQLNKIIFWQFLNVDQLLLNYLIFDCLEQITAFAEDYQQGFNDLCGSLLSLKIISLTQSKKKLSWADVVKQVAQTTASLIAKFKPLIQVTQTYVNSTNEKILNDFIILEIKTNFQNIGSYIDLNGDINFSLYFFKWLLNLFSKDFSLNVMMRTHLTLRTLNAQDMVFKAIKLCLRIVDFKLNPTALQKAKLEGGTEMVLIQLTNIDQEECVLKEKEIDILMRGL